MGKMETEGRGAEPASGAGTNAGGAPEESPGPTSPGGGRSGREEGTGPPERGAGESPVRATLEKPQGTAGASQAGPPEAPGSPFALSSRTPGGGDARLARPARPWGADRGAFRRHGRRWLLLLRLSGSARPSRGTRQGCGPRDGASGPPARPLPQLLATPRPVPTGLQEGEARGLRLRPSCQQDRFVGVRPRGGSWGLRWVPGSIVGRGGEHLLGEGVSWGGLRKSGPRRWAHAPPSTSGAISQVPRRALGVAEDRGPAHCGASAPCFCRPLRGVTFHGGCWQGRHQIHCPFSAQ